MDAAKILNVHSWWKRHARSSLVWSTKASPRTTHLDGTRRINKTVDAAWTRYTRNDWCRIDAASLSSIDSASANKDVLQLKLNRQHCLLSWQGNWHKISLHHDTHFGINIVTNANCQAKVTCAWNLDEAATENDFAKARNAPHLHPV